MKTRLAALMLGCLAATPASAIDVGPGDYAIAPAGTKLGLLYFQHLRSRDFQMQGEKVPGSRFVGNVGLMRGLYYTTIASEPVVWQFVMPFSHLPTATVGGARQRVSEGTGDLTLGLTFWPIKPSNEETGTTLGLSAFVTAPTGKYKLGSVGIGEGTWTFTPQMGLIQGLGNGFFFDAAADVAFTASHTEGWTRVSRDPSLQVQAMLRKQFSPATNIAIGYSGQWGGDLHLDGVKTGQKTRRDQIRFYASTFVTKDFQIQGMIGRDIHADGGFKYDTVAQVRLLKVF